MSHEKELLACYDSQAQRFHNTRAFHKRPELQHIQKTITEYSKEHPNKDISIVDLGCWSGRLSERFKSILANTNYTYTWVDFSSGMIETAKKLYPEESFIQQKMTSYIKDVHQESTDIIISLAAFHHLETKEERLLVLKNMYKALHYWGKVILVNRSFSDRFLKKYTTQVVQSMLRSFFTLNHLKRNDIFVPRKDPESNPPKVYKRYYHLFTLAELRSLIQLTDFVCTESCFINQKGEKTSNRKESRNSIFILEKKILK